jgi:MFS family permease
MPSPEPELEIPPSAPPHEPLQKTPQSSGLAVFGFPNFRLFQVARFCMVVALEMQSVAVGWQIYATTKRPLDLGLVGLAQFVPGILLFLVSGHVVDRFNRRSVLILCYAGYVVCSSLLLFTALFAPNSVGRIYGVLILVGVVRSFNGPVSRAILPVLVPEHHFPSAVAWASSVFQAGTILGPALGGLAYAAFHGPAFVYGASATAATVAVVATLGIKSDAKARPREPVNLDTILAGFHYIWREKLILGSISLDLFAVLLGGAVALLPVYAREILLTGPRGLGLLRSAPAIGAGAMALFLAYRPMRRRAGVTMLWCVAGFGACTVIFGLSHSLVLSLVALVLVGASDIVSVIVRGTLIQVATPDEMRGRVNAVDMIFIGASNEFGQFESGLTAQWLGAVPAVVLGGLGAMVVTALWAWRFPELRNANSLTGDRS